MSGAPSGPLGPAGNNVRRNVRRLREQRRWSYSEVEERLARAGRVIPVLGLSAIDTGERSVDVDDLVALATVFDLGVEELLQSPADCGICHGTPPPGFMCLECETSALPNR
ncbi:helix-turn-helix transcriptional regulator [Streptomyces europaeiscabiei]|uniref:helix-turn-helix transcriptional regulator n=1 Tax=Streptomyces europaeiscabiei TaxID=146819 RepID=UPI0029A8587E|nr:helix-turn-helix transcriptional regulator [Streptomyces europaeiscabiei]MDX3835617.1 helix-turn-helix transcriptional regulator [Streptomyces europaeiscabiei]